MFKAAALCHHVPLVELKRIKRQARIGYAQGRARERPIFLLRGFARCASMEGQGSNQLAYEAIMPSGDVWR